jgi:hypothetical protein
LTRAEVIKIPLDENIQDVEEEEEEEKKKKMNYRFLKKIY